MGISSARSSGTRSVNNSADPTNPSYISSTSRYIRSKQTGLSRDNNRGRRIVANFRPSGQNYTIYNNPDGSIRVRFRSNASGPSTTMNLPFTTSPSGASIESNCMYSHTSASDCGRNPMHWDGCITNTTPTVNAGSNTAHWSLNSRATGSPQWGSGPTWLDYRASDSTPD